MTAGAERVVGGRYELFESIASGGMGTVQLGRQIASGGNSRVVAIKRLHARLANVADAHKSWRDEARVAMRVVHPNVVPTIDVVVEDDEQLVVMEYVMGWSVSRIQARVTGDGAGVVPPSIALGIVEGALRGLHAAHCARSPDGSPLQLIHRDVSPQNILVSADGTPRLIDFGIAKSAQRETATEGRIVKGKLSYASPEQIESRTLDPRTDVYSAGVVLWELLVGRRLFDDREMAPCLAAVIANEIPKPSTLRPSVPPLLDAIVARATAGSPQARYEDAEVMANTLLASGVEVARPHQIRAWLRGIASAELDQQEQRKSEIERAPRLAPREPVVVTRVAPIDLGVSHPEANARPADTNAAVVRTKELTRSRGWAPAVAILATASALAAGARLRHAAPTATMSEPPSMALASHGATAPTETSSSSALALPTPPQGEGAAASRTQPEAGPAATASSASVARAVGTPPSGQASRGGRNAGPRAPAPAKSTIAPIAAPRDCRPIVTADEAGIIHRLVPAGCP